VVVITNSGGMTISSNRGFFTVLPPAARGLPISPVWQTARCLYGEVVWCPGCSYRIEFSGMANPIRFMAVSCWEPRQAERAVRAYSKGPTGGNAGRSFYRGRRFCPFGIPIPFFLGGQGSLCACWATILQVRPRFTANSPQKPFSILSKNILIWLAL